MMMIAQDYKPFISLNILIEYVTGHFINVYTLRQLITLLVPKMIQKKMLMFSLI